MKVCSGCGVVVGDPVKHAEWHVADTAYDMALAKAVEDLVSAMHRINDGLEEARRVRPVA